MYIINLSFNCLAIKHANMLHGQVDEAPIYTINVCKPLGMFPSHCWCTSQTHSLCCEMGTKGLDYTQDHQRTHTQFRLGLGWKAHGWKEGSLQTDRLLYKHISVQASIFSLDYTHKILKLEEYFHCHWPLLYCAYRKIFSIIRHTFESEYINGNKWSVEQHLFLMTNKKGFEKVTFLIHPCLHLSSCYSASFL